MELYVTNDQLKEFSEVLTGEKVTFKITDKVFSLLVDEKEIAKVTEVEAKLLETEVPVSMTRARKLLSGLSGCPGQKNHSHGRQGEFHSLCGTASWMGKVIMQVWPTCQKYELPIGLDWA